MTAAIKVKLKPFRVPNFVLIDGHHLGSSVSLDQIDAETLGMLCDEFKKSVFKKAGKAIPETHTSS